MCLHFMVGRKKEIGANFLAVIQQGGGGQFVNCGHQRDEPVAVVECSVIYFLTFV